MFSGQVMVTVLTGHPMDLLGRNEITYFRCPGLGLGDFQKEILSIFIKVLFRALLYPGWSVLSMTSMAPLLESHF